MHHIFLFKIQKKQKPLQKQKEKNYEIAEINIPLPKNDVMLYSVEYLYNARKVISLKSESCVLYIAGKGVYYTSNTSKQTFHEKCGPLQKEPTLP
jgi:hypothetical protein